MYKPNKSSEFSDQDAIDLIDSQESMVTEPMQERDVNGFLG